jgi:hypothetical protein
MVATDRTADQDSDDLLTARVAAYEKAVSSLSSPTNDAKTEIRRTSLSSVQGGDDGQIVLVTEPAQLR